MPHKVPENFFRASAALLSSAASLTGRRMPPASTIAAPYVNNFASPVKSAHQLISIAVQSLLCKSTEVRAVDIGEAERAYPLPMQLRPVSLVHLKTVRVVL